VISAALLALLRCPRCGGRPAPAAAPADPVCAGCGAIFARRDGYLVAPPVALAGRDTDYRRPEYAATLGYRQVARPLLGAAVRQRWLQRWLFAPPAGPVLEIGCGDGRFAYWNRRRAHIVGLDAAPLFSAEALAEVDLVQGDARALPFADGVFQAAYSIDVLEHLDRDGLDAVMREARRVLAPGGRLFIFTNSREPSTFQPVIAAQRRLSAALRTRGIGDFAADDLRKSDHVKALATYEEFVLLAARHGFAVRRHRFWNGVAQGFIDNVLIRAGERLLLGRGAGEQGSRGAGETHPHPRPLPQGGRGNGARSGEDGALIPAEPAPSPAAAGPHSQDWERAGSEGHTTSQPPAPGTRHPAPSTQHPTPGARRQALSRRRPVALALAALTLAMQADVELLGRFRSGPFFALLERR
jgi:SAM-dependent methyltransferase